MASIALSFSGDTRGLTDQQRMFVAEYLVDFDATRAAGVVGYKNPEKAVTRLLKNKKIIKAIGSQQRRNIEKHIITRDEIISLLSIIAKKDIADLCDEEGNIQCDVRKLPQHARLWIEGVEVDQQLSKSGKVIGQKIKLKTVPRMQAIEYLMKHFGMFAPDKAEIKHTIDWDSAYAQQSSQPDGLDVIEGQIAEASQPEDQVEG